MDYEKYKNTLHYPDYDERKTYLKTLTDEIDNKLMTRSEREAAEADARNVVRSWANGKEREYHTETQRLTDLFYQDALEELGIENLPKPILDKLWSMAWDRGHSNGLYSVYDELSDLSDLAELAFKSGKESAK